MAKSASKSRYASTKTPLLRGSSLKATIMDQSGAGRKRLGELLSKEGYITSVQLQNAVKYQERHFGRIGSILVKLGYVDEEIIVNVLNRIYGYPVAVLSQLSPDPEALEILPYEIAKQFMAFPLKLEGETLEVTMAEPTDASAVENLQTRVRKNIRIFVSAEKDILEAYRLYYKIDDTEYAKYIDKKEMETERSEPIIEVDDFGSLVSKAVGEIELASPQENENIPDQFTAADAPIIKLVNGILIRAINEGVSDIHIEPFEKSLQVRYRVDGVLYMSMNLPLRIKNALTSRIKIISNLNIAERRIPQDGRFKLRMGKKHHIDFRVSTLPTLYGEKIVIRILDRSNLNIDLTALGFEPKILEVLKRCICRPYGLMIVTGPTGSGKTTTLYSILDALNKLGVNIMTAEDPVEFNFKGINQVSIKNEVGMTFAKALRAFLRQDPDIIMVGEIRDLETAKIAIKAAMTGHLVLSTLHTNDCLSTISRLIDIGIPDYLLAASVTMVLSQRLVRKLCPKCKEPLKYNRPDELEKMGFFKEEIPNLNIFGPTGCSECNRVGYKGRVGLFEVMEVNDEVVKAINSGASEDHLRRIACREGMVTLREAGLEKIRLGVASVEDVLKMTVPTKEAIPSYLLRPIIEHYDHKAVIIREGAHDKDFFSLVQGALLVVKKGKIITEIIEPGDFFGQIAAINGKPRAVSIISKGKTTVKRFPGDKITEIIEQYPEITKKLFEITANRLQRADQQVANLLLKDAIRKQQRKDVISIRDRRDGFGIRKAQNPWCDEELKNEDDRGSVFVK